MVKNVIAIVVLLVLGSIAYVVFRKAPAAQDKTATALIKPVPKDRLDAIRIVRREKAGDAAKAAREEIELKKQGDTWRMKKPVDYKVNGNVVDRIADALADLKVIDAIAENRSKHAELQVDDAGGVEVWALAGQEELAHLIVGISRNNMTFVRLPGKDTVYRIHGYHRSKFDKSAKDLRDKKIFDDFEKESLKKMTFLNEHGELALELQGEAEDAKFAPVGVDIKNFKDREADNIARSIARLSARDFVDEELPAEKTGLDENADRVIVEAKRNDQPATLTLYLGNKDEDKGQFYLKSSESDQVYLVSEYSVKKLRAKKEDFERTDEEVAKEKEREQKRKEAAQAGKPAMAGKPGTQQIPPDMMKKIQEQMAKNPPRQK